MVEENRYRDENIRMDTMSERTDITSGVGSTAPRVGEQETWKHKSFREASPDEVREMVKEKVAKGIAAVTGALEGFVERSRRGELAGKTRQAIEQAGETGREAISATSEQLSKTGSKVEESRLADNAKQAFQKVGETTRRVTGAVKEETQKTKEELGKGKSNVGGMSSQGTSMETSSYNKPHSLGGASELSGLGNKGTGTSDMPDIRNTALGTQEDIKRAERKGSSDRIDRV
jgi:hypothetical protein